MPAAKKPAVEPEVAPDDAGATPPAPVEEVAEAAPVAEDAPADAGVVPLGAGVSPELQHLLR